ncbi:MAG: ABC transporter ATP-binding protein [Bifidobacteriaceae bacterium]|jgi:ABC-type lipoprotein export system ATPase subunit|nr:ABC transporter ATP-binding protein [Bifidobacteriaceae bacterium]
MLHVDHVGVCLGRRWIIEDVSLHVQAGQAVAVVGRTGSGKSTLLACVMGLLRPQRGSVSWRGLDVTRLKVRELARLRRVNLGVVFQDGELMPALTAAENVALPAVLDGRTWPEAEARARELLASLGVDAENRGADTLSGGERQRTALARALVNDPPLLIADEPTGSLDAATRSEVADLLFDRAAREDRALLVVTHDPVIAGRANSVYTLESGRLVQTAGGGVG